MKIISAVKERGKIIQTRVECNTQYRDKKLGGIFYPDTSFQLELGEEKFKATARLEKVEYFPKTVTVFVTYILTSKIPITS